MELSVQPKDGPLHRVDQEPQPPIAAGHQRGLPATVFCPSKLRSTTVPNFAAPELRMTGSAPGALPLRPELILAETCRGKRQQSDPSPPPGDTDLSDGTQQLVELGHLDAQPRKAEAPRDLQNCPRPIWGKVTGPLPSSLTGRT